jgi:hypothetical protein
MNAAALYHFDGERLTVSEIAARVPALSESTVRALLRKGKTTTGEMLAYDTNAAKRRGGTRGRYALEAAGLPRSMIQSQSSIERAKASGYVPRNRPKPTPRTPRGLNDGQE